MPAATKRKSMIHAVENLERKNGAQNPDAPLTERQLQFCKFFVEERMTQTAAARAAGFAQAATAAYELMKSPKIQRQIDQLQAEYRAASLVSKRDVIEGFKEGINMAKLKGEGLTVIAGWREIGKMCGLYEASKTKIEVSVGGKVLLERMNGLSDEELIRMAEGDT